MRGLTKLSLIPILSMSLIFVTIIAQAGGPPMGPMATLPFIETFESDLSNWVRGGEGEGGFPLQDISDFTISPTDDFYRFLNIVTADGDTDPGLLMGEGNNGNGSSYMFLEANVYFPRGNNLYAVFQSWGDPNNPVTVGGVQLPWRDPETKVYGPWHCDGTGFGDALPHDLPQSHVLGGVADSSGGAGQRFSDECAWLQGVDIKAGYTLAWNGALTRDTAIWLRVYLGDTHGAWGEWSNDGGATWNPLEDRDGVINTSLGALSGNNDTDPAALAFGCSHTRAHRWYDNICVGNDMNPCPDVVNNQFAPLGPTPTPAGVSGIFTEEWKEY